jgi:hypothetical protein
VHLILNKTITVPLYKKDLKFFLSQPILVHRFLKTPLHNYQEAILPNVSELVNLCTLFRGRPLAEADIVKEG